MKDKDFKQIADFLEGKKNPSPRDISSQLKGSYSDRQLQEIIDSMRGSTTYNASLSRTLGDLIAQRYGDANIRSSSDLNKYLKNLKQQEYSGIDALRKAINPRALDLVSSFNDDPLTSGVYRTILKSDPELVNPRILLGGVYDPSKLDPSEVQAYIKGTLAHELGHANDDLVTLLKRGEQVYGKEWSEKVLDKLDKHPQYRDKIIDHIKNTPLMETSSSYYDLTPNKVEEIKDLVLEDAPSAQRTKKLELINNYEKLLEKKKSTVPKEVLSNLNVKRKNIQPLEGEGIHYSFDDDINRDIKRGSKEYTNIQSKEHHLPRMDIPGDTGHFEFRNLKRLLNNKGLLSALPIVGAGALAATGDAEAATLSGISSVDPTGISDIASEAYLRTTRPEYAKEAQKQDRINALPVELQQDTQAVEQALEGYRNGGFGKLKSYLKGIK